MGNEAKQSDVRFVVRRRHVAGAAGILAVALVYFGTMYFVERLPSDSRLWAGVAAAAAMGLSVGFLVRYLKRGPSPLRVRAGATARCAGCGYELDLRNPGEICPECGAVLRSDGAVVPGAPVRMPEWVRVVLWILVGAVFAGLVIRAVL